MWDTKGEKFRDIALLNEARRPLSDSLGHGGRDPISPYVFTILGLEAPGF
jgi:hypothetical protein